MRARWVVSRKRNRNLFDIANLWKRTVLSSLYEETFSETGDDIVLPQSALEAEADEGAAFVESLHGDAQPLGPMSRSSEKRCRDANADDDDETSRVRVRRRYGWDRAPLESSVVVGSSAPKGLITRWVHKRNRSETQPEAGPSSKRGRGFRPK